MWAFCRNVRRRNGGAIEEWTLLSDQSGTHASLPSHRSLCTEYTAEDGKGFHVRLPPDGQPSEKSSVKIISPEEAAAGGLDMGGLDLGSLGAPQ